MRQAGHVWGNRAPATELVKIDIKWPPHCKRLTFKQTRLNMDAARSVLFCESIILIYQALESVPVEEGLPNVKSRKTRFQYFLCKNTIVHWAPVRSWNVLNDLTEPCWQAFIVNSHRCLLIQSKCQLRRFWRTFESLALTGSSRFTMVCKIWTSERGLGFHPRKAAPPTSRQSELNWPTPLPDWECSFCLGGKEGFAW